MNMLFAQVESLWMHPALAAAGAAAVSIPIAVHLLSRLRRQRQWWAAMRFVRQAYQRQRTRMRFEQWLLLAVRCLIVLLAGLALARPMAGAWWSMLAGSGGTGRVVVLAIDNSLSTQATVASGADRQAAGTRFEWLRERSLSLIDQLPDGARVLVWPMASVFDPPGLDRAVPASRARQLVEALEPMPVADGGVRSLASLSSVLGRGGLGRQRPMVCYLSDHAGSDQQGNGELDALVSIGDMVVSDPMPSLGNVRVGEAVPRRRVLLVRPGMVSSVLLTVPVERFGDTSARESGNLEMAIVDQQGKVLARQQQGVTLSPGQSRASVAVTIPLPQAAVTQQAAGVGPVDGAGQSLRSLGVIARLTQWTGTNELAADDQSQTVVGLRLHQRVVVVAPEPIDTQQPTPGQWLRAALEAGQASNASFDQSPRLVISQVADIASLDQRLLAGTSMMWMLSPVADANQWETLAQYVRGGGLLVVTPPAATERDGAAHGGWFATMTQALSLPWSLDQPSELRFDDDPRGTDVTTADDMPPAGDVATAGQGRLRSDGPPMIFGDLAGDWADLIAPVRVRRALSLSVDQADQLVAVGARGVAGQARGGAGRAQSVASDGQVAASPWLVFRSVGRGGVMLVGSAIDVGWTNLPTMPLFVPMVHEPMAWWLGRDTQPPRLALRVPADSDPSPFERLTITDLDNPLTQGDADQQRAGALAEAGIRLPGLYRVSLHDAATMPESSDWSMRAANVPGKESDLQPRSRQVVEAMFGSTASGARFVWLDDDQPIDPLLASQSTGDLSRMVLGLLAMLVLIELLLARRFSHAFLARADGLKRVAGLWSRLWQPAGGRAS